ncbi:hypothetical protein [Pantoea sp. AS142]|uniref:hypothetical protein n=1 Tax=Pantoea sp. AS142 TaxID=3081292 RepID=UPI0030175102
MTTLTMRAANAARDITYRDIGCRLMLCYLCLYLEHVNVVFSKLKKMNEWLLNGTV